MSQGRGVEMQKYHHPFCMFSNVTCEGCLKAHMHGCESDVPVPQGPIIHLSTDRKLASVWSPWRLPPLHVWHSCHTRPSHREGGMKEQKQKKKKDWERSTRSLNWCVDIKESKSECHSLPSYCMWTPIVRSTSKEEAWKFVFPKSVMTHH